MNRYTIAVLVTVAAFSALSSDREDMATAARTVSGIAAMLHPPVPQSKIARVYSPGERALRLSAQ